MCKRQVDICVIKGLAIFMNLFIIGIALSAGIRAVFLYNQFTTYDPILQSAGLYRPYLAAAALLFIAIGIVIYGFVALCVNGFGMLICYCLVLILHALVTFVFGFYTHVHAVENQVNSFFKHVIDESTNITQDSKAMRALSAVQSDLMCCGLRLGKYQYYNESMPLPSTCCKTQDEECSGEDIWDENCMSKIQVHCILNNRWVFLMEWMFSGFMLTNSGVAYLHAMAVKHFFYY